MKRLRFTGAAVAWLLVRATLSLAALTATLVAAGPLAAVGLALVLSLLRPLRRGWLAIVPVAMIAPLSPVAAMLLGLRASCSEGLLLAFGTSSGAAGRRDWLRQQRARGIDAVCHQRRASLKAIELPVADSLDRAEAKVRDAKRGSGSIEEATVEYIATAAAEARPWTLLRSLPELVVALFSGVFEDDRAIGPRQLALGKGLILEEVGPPLLKAVALLLAVLVGALLFPGSAFSLGPITLPGWLAQGLAVLLLGLGLMGPSMFGLILGGALAIAGSRLPAAILIAGMAAIANAALKPRLESFVLGGVALRPVRREPYRGPRRLRAHWVAATRAAEQGRLPVAITLLEQLLAFPDCSAELGAQARTRLALHHYELGELEQAAAIWDEVRDPAGLPIQVLPAAGTVAAGLGDLDGAEKLLRRALETLPRRSPLRQRAALALAETCSRRGRPEQAIEVIETVEDDPWTYGGFAQMLDSEVQIAAALARQGNLDGARQRLADNFRIGSLEIAEAAGLSRDLRDVLVRSEGRSLLVTAEVALAQGRSADAVQDLESSLGRLDQSRDPDLFARARALLGVARVLQRPDEAALEALEEGVEALEGRRTQLHRADRRAALILAEADVYAWCFKALEGAANGGISRAAEVGAWLIESLRKSALAEMLRGGELELPPQAQQLVERITAIERRGKEHPAAGPGSALESELAEARAELASALSDEFATAYVPTPTSVEALRKVAREFGDVLAFYLPGGSLPGWRVWIRRTGEFELGRLEISDPEALALLSQLESGETAASLAFHAPPGSDAAAVWAVLGDALLPAGLAEALGSPRQDGWAPPLLVATDGVLGLLPWSALLLGDEPLGARAVVQMVPTLGILNGDEQDDEAKGGHVALAHLDPTLDGHARELALLQRKLKLTVVGKRADFVAELQRRCHQGAYIAAHGDGIGLAQAVGFEDGPLSAGAALQAPWPAWTFFAACLVGRVPVQTGQEPLGLPISCVLAGSQSVLAATVEVPSDTLPDFAEPLIGALAAGDHPASGLAHAQRAYFAANPDASVAECFGFICLTRSPARLRQNADPSELGSWDDIAKRAGELAEQDPGQARAIFERGLEVDPEPSLRVYFADFLIHRGDDPEAAGAVLEKALASHPDHLELAAMHAWYVREYGDDHDATRAALERVLRIDPDDEWAVAAYGRHLRLHSDDLELAARYYRRALAAEPQNAGGASAFGELLERSGDLAGARAMYERALGQEPNRRATSRFLAALLGRTEKDPERIARLYERAIRVEQEAAASHFNLWALTAVRNLEDRDLGRRILERGRASEPGDACLAVNLAWLRFEDGDREEAIPLAREAIALDGESEVRLEAWFYLAVLGEPEGAEKARREVERLLAEGARSTGWDFSRILARAREHGTSDLRWAEATADEIAGAAQASR